MNCIYTTCLIDFLFEVYSYFKRALAAIHQSGTMLFQEATCSDLIFSRVFCQFQKTTCEYTLFKYIKLICHSSHSFEQRPFFSIIKEQQPHIFKNEMFKLYLEDIIVINCNTSLVSGMYIFKDSLLFDDINCSHYFFMHLSLFNGST